MTDSALRKENRTNRYAGDAAWQEWFAVCSVARCGDAVRDQLADEVRSAMMAQLARIGFDATTVEGDSPVTFFDAYFKMKGSRETDKPLKAYFRDRIRRERLALRDFVCGTLFGAASGRIRDIVRDWIASVKGWKAHSLTGTDGARHLVWEAAASGGDARELAERQPATAFRPCAALDRAALRSAVRRMIDAVATTLKTEPRTVAFLFYATALNAPISSRPILGRIGLAKSQASLLRNKCVAVCRRFFEANQVDPSDILLPRVLFAVCTGLLTPEDRNLFIGKETA